MQINEVKCKSALSSSSLPGLDYSLNPYRGCQHSCAYCYVPNVLRIQRKKWGSFINIKTNIPLVLSKELKNKKSGVVGISTVTDPYQPIEKKYRLTRFCLEQLLKFDFPICIQTKSNLVVRDLDIISRFTKAEILFSIGSLNEKEIRIIEPFASSIKERLDAMKEISKSGIKTTVFFGPIYPSIKVGDILRIVETFKQNGASEIMIDKLNLKPGIKKNVIEIFPPYKSLIGNKISYQKIFNEIMKVSKEKNMKAVLAF